MAEAAGVFEPIEAARLTWLRRLDPPLLPFSIEELVIFFYD